MTTYQTIKKDPQIKKFCMYGFFKNLKFFEPYLVLFLLSQGLNLFQVGLLYAVRETITYLLEVPSGIIADHHGKRKTLLVCFVFYMVSFVCFFFGGHIGVLVLAMVFFGLGEAFRSGTHKALILTYLEQKEWFNHKTFVYGRTRSFSLLGSSLSAFLSIVLVLNLPDLNFIFLLSIVPYLLDFALVASYPSDIDEVHKNHKAKVNIFKQGLDHLRGILSQKNLRRVIISAASYDGIFKSMKDYIQPILSTIILAAGVGSLMDLNGDESLKVYLGALYGIFYIFSALVSRNIYRLTAYVEVQNIFRRMYDLMGVLLMVLAYTIYKDMLVLTMVVYFVLYLMMDARRPVYVDVTSDLMEKSQRVTVLSIESQMKAILMVVFAPLFGWVAHYYSMPKLFLGLGVVMVVANRFFGLKKKA